VSFLATSLTRAPGRQQTSLWDGSSRHIGPSVPLRTESPMTITLLFSLAGAVVVCGADLLIRGNPLNGPSPASSFAGPSHFKALYLLLKGNWEGEGAQEGIHLLSEQGPVSIPPCLLGTLFLLGGKRVGGSLLLVQVPPNALASGRAGSGSTSLSFSLNS